MKHLTIFLLCIILLFSCGICRAGNNNISHHNDSETITNNYDITNNYTGNVYNNQHDDRTINDYSHNITEMNNYIDNTVMEHSNIHQEANTLFSSQIITALYGGVPISLPEQEQEIEYAEFTTLHFNPGEVVAKLGPGEFSQFHINITSDQPIKLYLTTNRPNIKILDPVAIINTPNGKTYSDVLVTFEKGTYWTDGQVYFKNSDGDLLGQVRIVFENKKGIDHISRVIMDGNYTTIGHGMKQNRGTWGWEAMAGVRIDRRTNEESYYGILTYDW